MEGFCYKGVFIVNFLSLFFYLCVFYFICFIVSGFEGLLGFIFYLWVRVLCLVLFSLVEIVK